MTEATTVQDSRFASQAQKPEPGYFRVGVGAGFAGDRYEPARLLARFGALDALVFECLAERTIGLAHARLRRSGSGFDERIVRRLRETLPLLNGSAVVTTNAGAADPVGAANAVRDACKADRPIRVAAITGDSVLERLDRRSTRIWGSELSLADLGDRVLSANAYLGAGPITDALLNGANVVLTGRCGDAALFSAPLVARFGWPTDDLRLQAAGTLVGHLLECGGQLTGGYFSDPGFKDISQAWNIGFPYADVGANGDAIYSKLPGTGGNLERATVLEQLLYEIDDASAYLTPDVTLDLTEVNIEELADGRVTVTGALGSAAPETLKASVAVDDGFAGVAEISYAGPGCMDRARLAADIIKTRWQEVHRLEGAPAVSFVGVGSTRPWATPGEPSHEVRLRFSVRSLDEIAARTLCDEVEALYTNGPASGGGVTGSVTPAVGVVSIDVPRDVVEPKVTFV